VTHIVPGVVHGAGQHRHSRTSEVATIREKELPRPAFFRGTLNLSITTPRRADCLRRRRVGTGKDEDNEKASVE